jgi:hypothetical protein
MARKTGPLTFDDLFALWRAGVDPGYARPFVEGKAEGRETGIEAFEQGIVQLARVSEAIDRTTQAMFIVPWSGQTDEPARGASNARVTLRIERSKRFESALTFVRGKVIVTEIMTDYGKDGGQEVRSGRRFIIDRTLTFGPGEAGPLYVEAVAEQPGFTFNLSPIGSLRSIVQPGSTLANMKATIVPGVASHRLIAWPEPDVPIPEHVGQYVEVVTGANAGDVRRVIEYERPSTVFPHGGVMVLASTGIYRVTGVVDPFSEGEEVVNGTGGRAVFFRLAGDRMVIEMLAGAFVVGDTLTGILTGASATLDAIEQSPDMIAEVGACAWRMLSWSSDLGVTITNEEFPIGGVAPMLDELGEERGLPRSAGEDDSSYRKRISKLADVVSPNAIRRICNRILVPYGSTVCLREIGQAPFRGFFFDGDASSVDPRFAWAWDLDAVAQPADRWKVIVDYLEMRAFFLVGIPKFGFGEFGFAYDEGTTNAFDASPWFAFFDGLSVSAAILYRTIWNAIENAKAGGVGFDLYFEHHGCIGA